MQKIYNGYLLGGANLKKIIINNNYLKGLIVSSVLTLLIMLCTFISVQINSNEVVKEVINTGTDTEEVNEEYQRLLEHVFDYRNKAILEKNSDILRELYDTNVKTGLWAYEHEDKKMKYLENWSNKQGVKFKDIKTRVKVKKIKEKEDDLYGIICTVSTEYKYSYDNQPEITNMFRIGTYNYLNVKMIDNQYVITKEWYTDPFADSLNLENIKSDDIRNYILSQQATEVQLTNEQKIATEYAHKYCGAAANEEDGFEFNKKYKNYNPDGGDCANFASQIMFESGRFNKNKTWNYCDGNGTKAWVNAQSFKNYILNSGRGYLIANGKYQDVYKVSYKLRPGDFVAYEKGGRITHVSTVTGLDTKGYPLVTCHNTDRLLVPWDLGWSDKSIKFHLIKVCY